MWAVAKKDFKTLFFSPIGYVVVATFLVVMAIIMYLLTVSGGSIDFNIVYENVAKYGLPVIISLLTMRTFSEEKDTEKLLFSINKKNVPIIMGKIIAVMMVIGIATLISLLYCVMFINNGKINFKLIFITIIGFLLLAFAYTSAGTLISSLTESQVISALLTLTFLFLPTFISNGSGFFSYLFLLNFFVKFSMGLFSINSVIALVSFSITCVALTSLEMKMLKNKNKKQIWLSILLFVVMIVLYIELNIIINKINIPDIDTTEAKIYTVTEKSAEKISKVDKDVNIQLINFDNYKNSSIVNDTKILLEKYKKINNKIKVEEISLNDETTKYPYIIVSSGEKTRLILLEDLILFKYNTKYQIQEEYYLSEEFFTNAIISVTNENKDKIYFYLEKSIYKNATLYTSILERINSMGIDALPLKLSEQAIIPEDCKCILIPPFSQNKSDEKIVLNDFSDEEKSALEQYIKNGGNIIFFDESSSLTSINEEDNYIDTPNYNYIKSLYGFNISDGVIVEKDKKIQENPGYIYANINFNNDIFKSLNKNSKICMFDAGKINLEDELKLKELGVSYQVLVTASDTAYLRKDLSNTSKDITETDEPAGNSILGLYVEKNTDGKKSKAIVFSNSIFAINSPIYLKDSITNNNIGIEMILLDENQEIISNSINYLMENENIISRKEHYNVVSSSKILSDGITIKLIFIMPMLILFAGFFVWRHRKNSGKN